MRITSGIKMTKGSHAKLAITLPGSLIRSIDSTRNLVPHRVFICRAVENYLKGMGDVFGKEGEKQ